MLPICSVYIAGIIKGQDLIRAYVSVCTVFVLRSNYLRKCNIFVFRVALWKQLA